MADNKNENQHEDILLDYNYDGIQEYDNPLPNWWLMTFFGTIIFGFVYWVHYEFGGGPTLNQELAAEMKVIKAKQDASGAAEAASGGGATANTADLAKLFADPQNVAKGKELFAGKCASCHAEKGQGMIGPNLTDKFWIHGKGEPSDIVTVIAKGVADKGMPAWEQMLKPDELQNVAAFVYSIRGTNVPGGKAPQGEEVK